MRQGLECQRWLECHPLVPENRCNHPGKSRKARRLFQFRICLGAHHVNLLLLLHPVDTPKESIGNPKTKRVRYPLITLNSTFIGWTLGTTAISEYLLEVEKFSLASISSFPGCFAELRLVVSEFVLLTGKTFAPNRSIRSWLPLRVPLTWHFKSHSRQVTDRSWGTRNCQNIDITSVQWLLKAYIYTSISRDRPGCRTGSQGSLCRCHMENDMACCSRVHPLLRLRVPLSGFPLKSAKSLKYDGDGVNGTKICNRRTHQFFP